MASLCGKFPTSQIENIPLANCGGFVDIRGMTKIISIDELLEIIRKRSEILGLNDSEICRRANLPRDAISSIKKGHAPNFSTYLAIMNVLSYVVPLYGKLISGVGVEHLADHEGKNYVQIHEKIEYSSDLLAIVVGDDKYEPRYFKGTILYFRESVSPIPSTLFSKHPYVVKIKGQKPDVMLVREGSRPGLYNLIAIDGSSKITIDADLEWCAAIEGTRWEY